MVATLVLYTVDVVVTAVTGRGTIVVETRIVSVLIEVVFCLAGQSVTVAGQAVIVTTLVVNIVDVVSVGIAVG